MAYFLDLFSPETYEAFSRSDRTVSGFRLRHRGVAGRVKAGDRLVCYMTKLSRWVGVLEVLEGPYVDETPLFFPVADPFVVRFRVRPIAWLPVEKAVPIHEDRVWNALSFTRGETKGVGSLLLTFVGSWATRTHAASDALRVNSPAFHWEHDEVTIATDVAQSMLADPPCGRMNGPCCSTKRRLANTHEGGA